MPHTFSQLPGEPIIMATFSGNWDESDLVPAIEEITAMLEAANGKMTLIYDTCALSIGLEDAIQGANVAARQLRLFSHPKVRKTIAVSRNKLISLAAKGLNSAIFGRINITVVESVEEALALARA